MMVLTALIAPVILASRPLTQQQVYDRMLAKVSKAKTLSYEVHFLKQGGKYDRRHANVSVDLKRGYRCDGPNWTQVCDLKTEWTKGADGRIEIEEVDGFDLSYSLGFDIFPNQSQARCERNVAQKMKFDNRQCYELTTRYGESPLTSYTIYVEAKTFLPAGVEETQMGEFGYLVAYRNVEINPKLKTSIFVVPKSKS